MMIPVDVLITLLVVSSPILTLIVGVTVVFALTMVTPHDLSTRVSAVLDGQQRRRAGLRWKVDAAAFAALAIVAIAPLRARVVAPVPQPQLDGAVRVATVARSADTFASPQPISPVIETIAWATRSSQLQRFAVSSRKPSFVAVGGAQLPSPAAEPRPAFEVASVKENIGGGVTTGRSVMGSVTYLNQPARALIATAYGMRRERVVGGPAWIDSVRFDVTARAPENTPDDQLVPMLRTLLADRFKLVVRTEARDQPVYALALAREDGKLGPSLTPSTGCEIGVGAGSALASQSPEQKLPCGVQSFSDARGATKRGGGRTLAELARSLERDAGRVVIDRTGLSGTFDFQLRYAENSQSAASNDSNLPVLFTALQEQLGLKLEAQRGPVEFLVIDQIQRPTPD